MLFIVGLLFVFCALAHEEEEVNCQELVCNPCRESAVPADFIFVIDASASMQNEIDTVKRGLSKMSEEIQKEDVDPRYWVVLVGYVKSKPSFRHELVIGGDNGLRDAAKLQEEFGKIRTQKAVSGFQDYKGGHEATLEAARMALGEEKYNLFDHRHVGGTGRIKLRADSKKFMVVLTDEDSDGPIYAENYKQYGFTKISTPTSFNYATGPFAEELKKTIDAFFNAQAIVYIFTRITSGQSRKQFGDPTCDSSNADFSNFDAKKTLDCLNKKGLGPSLSGALLQRERLVRTFNVLDIEKQGFIENFFADAVRAVARCQLRKRHEESAPVDKQTGRKRQMPELEECVSYECDPKSGCSIVPLCKPGCNQCKIDGKCYLSLEQNPDGGCSFCIPEKSETRWSTCGGAVPDDKCREYRCFANFGFCDVYDVCTVECERCKINNQCYKKDWANPANTCLRCQPTEQADDWTDVCPKCTPECQNGGVCEADLTGAKCNCEGTGFEGDACEKTPVCTPDCKNDGVCLVGGMCDCEGTGFKGDDCSTCVDNCEALKKECAPQCQNDGICDTETGVCVCDGTGFSGASCEIMDEPATTPAPPFMPDTKLVELCKAQCAMSCNQQVVDTCICDDTGALVTFECSETETTSVGTTPANTEVWVPDSTAANTLSTACLLTIVMILNAIV